MVIHWPPTIALGLVALITASLRLTTEAHSWIDCIDSDRKVVYDNARNWIYGGETTGGICAGYINNYPGRGDPDINTKLTYKILMDDVTKGAAPCAPYNDGSANSKGFKRFTVSPEKQFYYAYLDNGHTSKDKAGRGTFYGVYWTGEPGTSLTSTTQLTDDKLIDGKLHDFDDKNCGQTYEDGDFSGKILSDRAGNDFSCVGDLEIPKGTKPGVYNLIWFWRFYNDKVNADILTTGGHYGGAAYSSCFQVNVTNSIGDGGGKKDVVESEATSTPVVAVTANSEPSVTPAPTPEETPTSIPKSTFLVTDSVTSAPATVTPPIASYGAEPTAAPVSVTDGSTPAPTTVMPAPVSVAPAPPGAAYEAEPTPAPVPTMGVPQYQEQPSETPKLSASNGNDAANKGHGHHQQNQQHAPKKDCGVKEDAKTQGYLRT